MHDRPVTGSAALGEREPGLAAALSRMLSWVKTEGQPSQNEVQRALGDEGIVAKVVDQFRGFIGLWADDPKNTNHLLTGHKDNARHGSCHEGMCSCHRMVKRRRHTIRVSIASKRELSSIAPFEHFDVPTEWTRTYPVTAKGVPAAESFSAQTAAGLVASFIDPALGRSPYPAVWDPYALAWIPDTSGPLTPEARSVR